MEPADAPVHGPHRDQLGYAGRGRGPGSPLGDAPGARGPVGVAPAPRPAPRPPPAAPGRGGGRSRSNLAAGAAEAGKVGHRPPPPAAPRAGPGSARARLSVLALLSLPGAGLLRAAAPLPQETPLSSPRLPTSWPGRLFLERAHPDPGNAREAGLERREWELQGGGPSWRKLSGSRCGAWGAICGCWGGE